MKKIIFFAFFVLSIFGAYAEVSQTSWKVLEQATRALDEDNPGSALRYAEIAKELRKIEYQNRIDTLESAIIPLPVQQVGDLIPDVLYILESRNSYDAVKLINELVEQKGSAYFSNSITKMQEYLELFLEYPEADFLIGKVYMYEGEYEVAKEYYLRALENSDILDIPDVQFDIRYELVYLAKIQKDYNLYEESLLSILEQSPYYNTEGDRYNYAKAALNAAIQPKLADKYFLLYRIDSKVFIPAYLKIAEFYKANNENEKSFFASMIAVLASFTRINEIISMRDYEYVYSNLNDFFQLATSYSDINNWLLENDVWSGIMLFADYVKEHNNSLLAKDLYQCIENYCPIVSLRNIAKLSH